MGALNDGLHPAQPRVAGGTDLGDLEGLRWQFDVVLTAFVEEKFAVAMSGPNGFAFPGYVDEIVVDRSRPPPKLRIARSLGPDAIQQTHPVVDRAAKIGGVAGVDGFEMFDEVGTDVVRQLPRDFCLPARQQSFRVERRKLFLDLVREFEI